MKADRIKQIALEALDDLKGQHIVTLDVRGMTSVTDYMIICTGSSNRHVKSLAENVAVEAKRQNAAPIGVEGDKTAEWVLVDFGDVVVHVMLAEARDFYELEKLWTVS